MSEEKWCIYRHTFPDGKVYIGKTKNVPEERWGKNGRGYQEQTKVFNAILEFGWRNIKHEILFQDLSELEATIKEEELIKKSSCVGSTGNYNVACSRGEKETLKGNNAVITNDSLRINGRYLTDLPDMYYDHMIEKYGTAPMSTELTEKGALIELWRERNGQYVFETYEIAYPKKNMTFHDVKKWLIECDECGELVKESTFTKEQVEKALKIL